MSSSGTFGGATVRAYPSRLRPCDREHRSGLRGNTQPYQKSFHRRQFRCEQLLRFRLRVGQLHVALVELREKVLLRDVVLFATPALP